MQVFEREEEIPWERGPNLEVGDGVGRRRREGTETTSKQKGHHGEIRGKKAT